MIRLSVKWARMYLNIIGKCSRHKCKAKLNLLNILRKTKEDVTAFGNMNPFSVDTE